MPSAIETFLLIIGVGNQGQQQLVVYLGSLLGSPCQQLRSVFLISGVGVSVRWSSCHSFPGVSKLQLPPSDFPPSVPPIAYIGTIDMEVVSPPLYCGLQMPVAG